MFVKHCKVEVYLIELKLSENSDSEKMVSRHFSKADTIGERRVRPGDMAARVTPVLFMLYEVFP